MRDYTKEKLKVLIKAYLLTHNKECTANEIARWINFNNLGINADVSANSIARILQSAGINRKGHIFNDIKVNKGNGKPNTYELIRDG